MNELSIVEPFDVPGVNITLFDMRTQSGEVHRASADILSDIISGQLISTVRPDAQLCGPAQMRYAEARFQEFLADDPNGNFGDFVVAIGDDIVPDDSECDPRLPTLTFAVFARDDENIGRWDLYNIRTESVRGDNMVISAMCMPGVGESGRRTLLETWSAIMRRILEFDMQFENGGTLDLVAWKFPTRREHRWNGSRKFRGLSGDELIPLIADGHVLESSQDGVFREIRRRPAPSART